MTADLNLNPETVSVLFAGMVECAVDDYRRHERGGWIAGGQLSDHAKEVLMSCDRSQSAKKTKLAEVTETIAFFRDGRLERVLELGELPVSPAAIRRKLGISLATNAKIRDDAPRSSPEQTNGGNGAAFPESKG